MAREPELEDMLDQPKPKDELGVQGFLDRFGKAAGDGEAIAEMWETPAFVLGASP